MSSQILKHATQTKSPSKQEWHDRLRAALNVGDIAAWLNQTLEEKLGIAKTGRPPIGRPPVWAPNLGEPLKPVTHIISALEATHVVLHQLLFNQIEDMRLRQSEIINAICQSVFVWWDPVKQPCSKPGSLAVALLAQVVHDNTVFYSMSSVPWAKRASCVSHLWHMMCKSPRNSIHCLLSCQECT